jgi:hypothetical protein
LRVKTEMRHSPYTSICTSLQISLRVFMNQSVRLYEKHLAHVCETSITRVREVAHKDRKRDYNRRTERRIKKQVKEEEKRTKTGRQSRKTERPSIHPNSSILVLSYKFFYI